METEIAALILTLIVPGPPQLPTPRPDLFAVFIPTPTPAPSATPTLPPPGAPGLTLDHTLNQMPWLPALIALAIVAILNRAQLRAVVQIVPWKTCAGVAAIAAVLVGLITYQAVVIDQADDPNLAAVFQTSLAVLVALLVVVGSRTVARVRPPVPAPASPPTSRPPPVTIVEIDDNLPAQPDAPPQLPGLFLAAGARVLIVGPSRSGKSTLLHHLCRRALADLTFDQILLLDGKGPELAAWAGVDPSLVEYHGPEDFDAWVDPLERLAAGLLDRYNALSAAGQRAAEPGAPRKLIVIDEIQRATRSEAGRKITQALLTISEQSGALRDVLILTTQRATHRALDKNIAFNVSLVVAMRSPDHVGQFNLFTSLTETRPARKGQARPADDSAIAAWAADVAQARAQAMPSAPPAPAGGVP